MGNALRKGSKRWSEREQDIADATVRSDGEYKANHYNHVSCCAGATHVVVSLLLLSMGKL